MRYRCCLDTCTVQDTGRWDIIQWNPKRTTWKWVHWARRAAFEVLCFEVEDSRTLDVRTASEPLTNEWRADDGALFSVSGASNATGQSEIDHFGLRVYDVTYLYRHASFNLQRGPSCRHAFKCFATQNYWRCSLAGHAMRRL